MSEGSGISETHSSTTLTLTPVTSPSDNPNIIIKGDNGDLLMKDLIISLNEGMD